MGSCWGKRRAVHSPAPSPHPSRWEFELLNRKVQQLSNHQILVDKLLWGGVGPVVEMGTEVVYMEMAPYLSTVWISSSVKI